MQTTTRLATYSCTCTTVFRSMDNQCPRCGKLVAEPFYTGDWLDEVRRGTKLSQTQILSDVASISDGCLASLTGKRLYAEIAVIQADWYAWTEAQMATQFEFSDWKDAWQKYQEAQGV